MPTLAEAFRFLDPGPLIDHELELVTPEPRWIKPMWQSIRHPLTQKLSPKDAALTREAVAKFVSQCPSGRQPPDPDKNIVAQYHFWMRLRPIRGYAPPTPMAGGIALRVSDSEQTRLYYGHIGYNVFPPARGRHLAERACRLLLPLARRHDFQTIFITCNPENAASRRTCERLGASLIQTIDLPTDHLLYQRGERQKCRYRLDV